MKKPGTGYLGNDYLVVVRCLMVGLSGVNSAKEAESDEIIVR